MPPPLRLVLLLLLACVNRARRTLAMGAGPLAALGVGAEGQHPEGDQVGPAAGFFTYTGGPVRAKRARTQTAASTINETATWVTVPGASLQHVVPTGTTDLFNVAFSAEGRLFNGGADDYVRIRITDNGVPVEPDDAAFILPPHSAQFVKRLG